MKGVGDFTERRAIWSYTIGVICSICFLKIIPLARKEDAGFFLSPPSSIFDAHSVNNLFDYRRWDPISKKTSKLMFFSVFKISPLHDVATLSNTLPIYLVSWSYIEDCLQRSSRKSKKQKNLFSFVEVDM